MPSVCAKPGCPEIVKRGYCEKHTIVSKRGPVQRAADRKRESRHKRGYDSKWDKARKAYLKANPVCVAPDCSEPSTDVDHIKRWKVDGQPNWELFWDKTNWQALCHSCHSRKTRREARKGFTA